MESSLLRKDCNLQAHICDCHQDFLVKFKMTREKRLGRGLSGEVMLASFQDDPDKKRAVKVFAHSDMNAILFVTEVAILQKLNHPNILTGIEAYRCPNNYILSMPYYPAGSLKGHLKRMTTKGRIMKYFLQLSSAVLYLHAHDISHRDIKPDNVLVDDHDDLVLIDFGLAYHVTSHQRAYRVAGTKGYMAPEILTDGKLDLFKCDLYALGVVLWNLVFQTVPPASTDYLHYVDKSKSLPDMYRTLLHNLLHPDPEARWDDKQLVNAIYTFPKLSKMADKLWGKRT